MEWRLARSSADSRAEAVAQAVETHSTVQCFSLALGYYVVELTVPPVLNGTVEWIGNVLQAGLLAMDVSE